MNQRSDVRRSPFLSTDTIQVRLPATTKEKLKWPMPGEIAFALVEAFLFCFSDCVRAARGFFGAAKKFEPPLNGCPTLSHCRE